MEKEVRKLTPDEIKFKELNDKLADKIATKKEITTLDRNIVSIMPYAIDTATELFELKENTKFGVFMGKDPLDINIVNLETKEYLYESPAKDVEKKLIEFEKEYSRHKAIFIYGIGNGIFLKSLLANPSHAKIIVFEPELEILYAALSLIDFSQEIFKDRLIILKADMVKFIELYIICRIPDIFNSLRLYNLHIINDYYAQDKYKDNILTINQEMARAISQAIKERGNDSKDNLIGMEYTTKHLPNVFSGVPLKRIIDKRKKKCKSAVIVSTGPSLAKQLPMLKKLASYTTIIAVDASYPVLKKYGIKPDYVTSIERVPATSKFFSEPVSDFDDGIIFIVASLTHDDTVANLKGREVCYALRPLAYEMSFKDYTFGYIGGGQSAAHMAFNVAQVLECDDIILIGQDLAFGEDGSSHSKGHIFKSTEIDPTKREKIMTTKYGGVGEIATTTTWNVFRTYFEHSIANLKRANGEYPVYNCTEGGARIEGTIEVPFKQKADEIIKAGIKKKFATVPKLTPKQQELRLIKTKRYLKSVLKYGEKLQRQCEKMFLKIAKEIEKDKKLIAKDQKDKIDYMKLQQISFDIDALKEKTYKEPMFLSVYYAVCSSMLLHQELELAVISARRVDNEDEKNDKLFEWVSCQSYWFFSLAGSIDAALGRLKEASKDWMGDN
ncbi:motility accessory factor [Campylobacter iguaniorum]|uniref:motility associated factor glycosyltransferase family protein n=1 Tax=Campylobacter iguaniorum TaxID=1244531 RepID=UPI00073A21C0|nr:6-hydroxymethylpterin diphosphokinase MptE-like protein [Campylobacter iguaniorum]ALV25294.1 motility accessory factor [Campylobacter iguaniorum]